MSHDCCMRSWWNCTSHLPLSPRGPPKATPRCKLKRSRKKPFWLSSKVWVIPRVFMSKLRKLVSYKVVKMKRGHVHKAPQQGIQADACFLFPESTRCRFSESFPFFVWNCLVVYFSLLISTKNFKIPSSDILSLTSVLSIILNRRCCAL